MHPADSTKRYDVILYGKNTGKVRRIVGFALRKELTRTLVEEWEAISKYKVAVVKANKYHVGSLYKE